MTYQPPEWQPQQPPPQPWPPQQYGYGQPAPPPPYRPPPQVVTKQSLSGGEHAMHAILSFFTGGLWGIVWIIRAARGRKTVTTYPLYPPNPQPPY
jgi:hypothetical protein